MTIYNTTYQLRIYLAILGVVLLASCKTEYETAPSPYTEITSFKIPYNAGKDTIVAAVDGETIYISWPGMTEWPIPETVTPLIIASKNATISPASGEAIRLENGTVYRIKAEDGTVKTYTIKLSNGAILPSFSDEETIVSNLVGAVFAIPIFNAAMDGSDSLYLVDGQNKSYKLIANAPNPESGMLEFYMDQIDGSGIPAGDYYAQIINKYRVPVRSSKKFVTVLDEQPLPYVYLNHDKEWEVKRGEIILLPTRYLKQETDLRLVSFNYINTDGYPENYPLEYIGLTEDLKAIKVKIPEDAPIGLSSDSNGAISIRIRTDRFYNQPSPSYPYAIKIIE